ncbi:MAG TPA: hypothetical protein PKE47_06930 [Verrucomicrobiota bacterium]|nr:hypothetical protein [Verrucomicrobiota bacterium]
MNENAEALYLESEKAYQEDRWEDYIFLSRQAARLGHVFAAANLGLSLDDAEGFQWAKASMDRVAELAVKGNGYAALKAAGLVESKHFEPTDYARRAYFLEIAARSNHANSQYELGEAYADGLGVIHDPIEAAVWLLIARANGESSAIDLCETILNQLDSNERKQARENAKILFSEIRSNHLKGTDF